MYVLQDFIHCEGLQGSFHLTLPWPCTLAGGRRQGCQRSLTTSACTAINICWSQYLDLLALPCQCYISQWGAKKPLSFLPRRKWRKKREKSSLYTCSHQEGIVFGLWSTFCYKFAWCDVCFGRCGGGVAAGMPALSWLLCLRAGRSRVLPAPGMWSGDAWSLGDFRRWSTVLKDLLCWDAEGCVLHSNGSISGHVGGRSRVLTLSLRKSITPWSNFTLAGRWSVQTNRSFPL